MATRSTISIKYEDDSVRTIYCHFDGNPEHHLPILNEFYNTFEKAEELINLGDISSLDNSPECPEEHSFQNSIDGYCVAYGRDRKEEETEARKYFFYKQAVREEGQLYNYLFENNEWSCIRK